MSNQKMFTAIALTILITALLAGCVPAAAPPPAAAPTPVPQAPAAATPATQAPTELRVAAIVSTGLENDWDATFIEAFERVRKQAPHGLTIHELDITEGIRGDDAERVMREYLETGKYDIIWGHSAYADQVRNLRSQFPQTMFVLAGAGNEGLGENVYVVDKRVFESAYLCGVIAGRTTKSNMLGAVGPFPVDAINAEINAFFEGARSVNPNVKVRVSFVESWFDPAKSNEAAMAQIAAGVDQIFMRADAFDACEKSNIYCYGPVADNTPLAPNSVVANALAFWDPEVKYAIDQWYEHKVAGKAFDAPKEGMYWSTLASGGTALSAINEKLIDKIPKEVVAEVETVNEAIRSGSRVLTANTKQPTSD